MNRASKSPRDVARALSARRERASASGQEAIGREAIAASAADGWKRQTFRLPRLEARAKAREWFGRFPKAAYMTEIEFWRELDGDRIEFTIRRLPSAD